MSNNSLYIDDRRGLIFTINREADPVYQVDSKAWAHAANRWNPNDIPQEIHDKVAYLRDTGKPGAFVPFDQGEDGVYVLVEENIKSLPEPADDDVVFKLPLPPGSARALAPYDIVICTKSGTIHGENGETFETQAGDYYVVRCQSWGRFFLPTAKQPHFVATTKDFLLLLENLHTKNFLSMSPDPEGEVLPPDFGEPLPALDALNCYVLNLSRFTR